MDGQQMLRIIEHYSREAGTEYGGIKITRVPDFKTIYIEQSHDGGRAVTLTEYKVDGATYWAGYSPRSQTVFISIAA